ncbi:type II toxin-antitoxin system RelE/ParE family toxin [Candidatus Poribacteria bacterium]|nr:type II toxin-antitoxin system RelE/ParE family toxin [Candidatus Poribacteria bacterium]
MPNHFVVNLSNRSQSDLRAFPKSIRNRILRGIRQLETNPFPRGKTIRQIQGMVSIFRLRIGDYRVIYQLTEIQVEILRVIHRQELERALRTLF